jgi:hypothetical protein
MFAVVGAIALVAALVTINVTTNSDDVVKSNTYEQHKTEVVNK